jgi:hypothetical protein
VPLAVYDIPTQNARGECLVQQSLFEGPHGFWQLDPIVPSACRRVTNTHAVSERWYYKVRCADYLSDGSWKYVKPYPGSITVNIADVLQFWTAGKNLLGIIPNETLLIIPNNF